ncbi:unnamed protein product, partial [Choristocarpus tenellus]
RPLLSFTPSAICISHWPSNTLCLPRLSVEFELEQISHLLSPCDEGDSQQYVEGGVAVVSRIDVTAMDDSTSEVQPHRVAEAFARNVQDAWRVGKQGCDNGFVLALSRDDRMFALSLGHGLEDLLPEAKRTAVLASMVPHLQEGNFDNAILSALRMI